MAVVLWPNTILIVCAGVVLSIVGYIVYGVIVGFGNTFKEYENKEIQCDTEEER